MTYKDWLYTLILGGNGSSSSSDSGGDSESNEPLIVNILKVEELPDTWDKSRFNGEYLLDKTGQEINNAIRKNQSVIFCLSWQNQRDIQKEDGVYHQSIIQEDYSYLHFYRINDATITSPSSQIQILGTIFQYGLIVPQISSTVFSIFSTVYDTLHEYPVFYKQK